MSQSTIFRTHGSPSTLQDCHINRAWSEYAQTLDMTSTTRQQREALRAAFYAGAIAQRGGVK